MKRCFRSGISGEGSADADDGCCEGNLFDRFPLLSYLASSSRCLGTLSGSRYDQRCGGSYYGSPLGAAKTDGAYVVFNAAGDGPFHFLL